MKNRKGPCDLQASRVKGALLRTLTILNSPPVRSLYQAMKSSEQPYPDVREAQQKTASDADNQLPASEKFLTGLKDPRIALNP